MLAVGGGTWLAAIAPENVSAGAQVIWAVSGGLLGLVIAVVFVFAWRFLRAPYLQRNEARADKVALEARLAEANDGDEVITPQPQLFLGLLSESPEFGDETTEDFRNHLESGGHRLVRLQLFLSANEGMALERVRAQIAGKTYEASNWQTLSVGRFSGVSGCSVYFPIDTVTPGTHDVRLEGYAEGKWWRSSKAYPIWFPRQ